MFEIIQGLIEKLEEVNFMKVLLSIIVTIYNIEKYVEKCIESIINQTYKNLEIILVDDGSTDSSGKLCDKYAACDERIIVVHKENGGLVSARKAGAAVASGDYIINVDGDDWIERNRFEGLVYNGLKEMPDMVYMDGCYREYKDKSVFSSSLEDIFGTYLTKQIWDEHEKFLIRNDYFINRVTEFSQWSWCVRKEIYVHNEKLLSNRIVMLEDAIVIVACLLESQKVTYINEPSYHYLQQREGSINSRKNNYSEDSAKIFYQEMSKIVARNKEVIDSTKENVIAKFIYNSAMLTNYKKLYDHYNDYLFPYLSVENNSKVVVYGAGNLGVEIVNAIDTDDRFQLVAWVDKEKKENARSNHKIDSPEILNEIDFLYIVIAVINAETAKKIKEELMSVIPENKIKLMDSRDMSMKHLEAIFGE